MAFDSSRECEQGYADEELTGYTHAVRPVGLAPKEFIPHLAHIMEWPPWRSQESPPVCTPTVLSTLERAPRVMDIPDISEGLCLLQQETHSHPA